VGPTQPPVEEWVYGWKDWRARFGSAHSVGCNFVLCDGSVRMIGYTIDPEVHRRLANRRDGKPIDASQY